ncbi:MAG: hypothetical protein HYX75_08940 [Acidobacteria bacterium]|nr:hypothetical protein [Acidobacteriota bacterium]
MVRHMDRDLAHRKEMLFGMGRRVQGIYEQTVEALPDGDTERARLIVAADDKIETGMA